jgi:hypothetical protein
MLSTENNCSSEQLMDELRATSHLDPVYCQRCILLELLPRVV